MTESTWDMAGVHTGALTRAEQQRARLAPLTFQQEWGLHRWMHEAEDLWDISPVLRLSGLVNVAVLCRSLDVLVQRHDALRTRLVTLDGELKQAIDHSSQFRLKIVKCRGGSKTDLESDARSRILEFLVRPIDLELGPLFDAIFLELAEQEHVLAIRWHHSLADPISLRLTLADLWSLYGDFIRDRPSSLSKPALQYPDYAIWQRSVHGRRQEHSDYWNAALSDTSGMHLPPDRGLETVKPLSSAFHSFAFDREVSSSLYEMARRERTSAGMLMLTLYAVLLSSWSDQRDFVVPFNVAGRFWPAHARVIGLLAHYLPVRVKIAGSETFLDVLHQISLSFLTACAHVDFGKVTYDVPDLFKGTSFNWFHGHPELREPREWGGRDDCFSVGRFAADYPDWPSRLPCETYFVLEGKKDGMAGFVAYRADLFASQTMETFCSDFQRLAARVLRTPRLRVSAWIRGRLSA